jgi:hypothetical protein
LFFLKEQAKLEIYKLASKCSVNVKKTEFLEKLTFYVDSSLIYFVFSKDQKHLKVNVTTLTTEQGIFGL